MHPLSAGVDVSVVVETSGAVRAGVSFLFVLAFGAVVLARYRGLVDRSVEDVVARPRVAVVYGLVAYVIVAFFAFYANDLLIRTGLVDTALGYVAFAILAGGGLALSGFGFVVAGTVLSDVLAGWGPRYGLVVGAALSAAGWLALPFEPALVAWLAVAAFGVGGRTRRWVHAERTVESEASG